GGHPRDLLGGVDDAPPVPARDGHSHADQDESGPTRPLRAIPPAAYGYRSAVGAPAHGRQVSRLLEAARRPGRSGAQLLWSPKDQLPPLSGPLSPVSGLSATTIAPLGRSAVASAVGGGLGLLSSTPSVTP